jgi:hypothetical protein
MTPTESVVASSYACWMAMTRDHMVPKMYLKRWGRLKRQAYHLRCAPVTDLGRAFSAVAENLAAEGDFYRGTTPDGVDNHDMERFLGKVEGDAAPAFRRVLDAGHLPEDSAFPPKWPPRPDHRMEISWWLAAQILRTDHQRQRLWRQLTADPAVATTPHVNHHLAYIAEMIRPLAAALYLRPWGFGWSDTCLLTSDTPAVILNGQDADNQLLAASFWDIYLPLDPHRLLFLPGAAHRNVPTMRRDHTFKLEGGLGIALNSAILDAARRHVFWHEDHDPTAHQSLTRSQGPDGAMSQFLIQYMPLTTGMAVQRRWLDEHPVSSVPQRPPQSEDELMEVLNDLTERMDQTQAKWDRIARG